MICQASTNSASGFVYNLCRSFYGGSRMEWIEAEALPAACLGCLEEECYNCDAAGERWVLSEESERRLKQKLLHSAIDRTITQLHRAYTELDRLAVILNKEK